MEEKEIGRWASFAMGFGMGFVNFWNRKKIVFPALFVAVIALGLWYWYLPSLLSLVLFLLVLITTILLGLTGLITMPIVKKDLSKTVRVVTATLATLIPVIVILLCFMFWMLWPVLFVAAEPEIDESMEFDMEVEKMEMEDYTIEGPKDFKGEKATLTKAAVVYVDNLTIYYGGKTIFAEKAKIEGLTLYTTYTRGSGEALRVESETAWYGHESPPFVVSLMSDPVVMTDIKMHVIYQNVKSIKFEKGMKVSDSDGGSTISAQSILDVMACTSDIYLSGEYTVNSFEIKAERMEMDLSAIDLLGGMLDLEAGRAMVSDIINKLTSRDLGGLLSAIKMGVPAKNVVMVNGTIEVPYGDETVVIGFDKSTIESVDMELTLINSLSMIMGDPIEMLMGMVTGRRIELKEVEMVGEWMSAKNVELEGLKMEPKNGYKIEGEFTVEMDGMKAASMDITRIGYDKENRPYLVIDVTDLTAGKMILRIPDDYGNEITIETRVKNMEKSEMWAYTLETGSGEINLMNISELPHKLTNQELKEMESITIKGCFLNATGLDLANMTMSVSEAKGFSLVMSSQEAKDMTITGTGELNGQPYMVIELYDLSVGNMSLIVPGTSKKMAINVNSQNAGKVVMHAFSIKSDEVTIKAQKVSSIDEPLKILGDFQMSGDIQVELCYLETTGETTLTSMEQVVT
jgi:hypothetical protein